MKCDKYIKALKDHIREHNYLAFVLEVKRDNDEHEEIDMLIINAGSEEYYKSYFASDEEYSHLLIRHRARKVLDMFFGTVLDKSAFYTVACAYAENNVMHLFVPVCVQGSDYPECGKTIQSIVDSVAAEYPVYLIGASGDIIDDLYYYLFKVEIRLSESCQCAHVNCEREESQALTVNEMKEFIEKTVKDAVNEEIEKRFNEYILPSYKETPPVVEPSWSQYPFPKPWEVTSTYFTC